MRGGHRGGRGRRGAAVVGMLLLAGACSTGGGGDPKAEARSGEVCLLLTQPLAATALPLVAGDATVAELLERIGRHAREEEFGVVVFLQPGIVDADVAAAVAVVEGAIEANVVVFTPADALVEFEALFGDDHPEFVDRVDEGSLPSSIRFETEDLADVERVTTALAATAAPVYRIVDSRDFVATGARSLALFAAPLLERLAAVEDDDVADAARRLGDVRAIEEGGADGAEAAEAAVLLLADRATECGPTE